MYLLPTQKIWQQSHTDKPTYIKTRTTTSPFTTIQPSVSRKIFLSVHYSSYYSWLKQAETLVDSYSLTNTHTLLLTNKHLIVRQPRQTMTFPLHSVQTVSMHFRRMLLPLVIGGIVAPLFGAALWNHTINFWIGLLIMMIGLALFYYGWIGTYQIDIQFATYRISYFSDYKTLELENLLRLVNTKIKERNILLLG